MMIRFQIDLKLNSKREITELVSMLSLLNVRFLLAWLTATKEQFSVMMWFDEVIGPHAV